MSRRLVARSAAGVVDRCAGDFLLEISGIAGVGADEIRTAAAVRADELVGRLAPRPRARPAREVARRFRSAA